MGLFSRKGKEPEKPEVLLSLRSHSCPITAIVEQDNRVAYFYLWGDTEQFGVKSCWIRNLSEAPKQREEKLMNKGIPPMMPKAYCKHPEGQAKLNKEDLEIVWLEEGDGAALLERGAIVAIIPAWSGQSDFSGYARDCIGTGDFAWELGAQNEMPARIASAREFFNSWHATVNPFQTLQPELLSIYEEIFGKSDRYFAIDREEWPPKGVYLQVGERRIVFATVAVSLRPQPAAEMYVDNRNNVNRIELGLIVNTGLAEERIKEIASWISGQTNIPWDNITFLGEGHTINFDAFQSPTLHAVLLTSKLDKLPEVALPDYRGSVTNFLWMVPISARERDKIMADGSESVIPLLNQIGEEIFNLDRQQVV